MFASEASQLQPAGPHAADILQRGELVHRTNQTLASISARTWRQLGKYTMPGTVSGSHFRTTQKLKVQYSPHSFTEYVSSRTGMRVVVVDQKGPKVLVSFAAATEILDDSGSPHTLEHLCFMGSRSHPYKGLLDQLATRGYSTTNAWTATDHTAYTLETAGYEAFAKILPIYLEHVILPTLTDAGCYTEVFHVDGSGNDAGVVYSEMQGVQNTQSEIMELRGKRLMYPDGIGFRYETGGMMEQLRVLTADRIRRFHREMYQPKNLCLILVGQIDHKNLLETLDKFEDSIIDDIPSPDAPFKRPWLDSVQPPLLNNSISETVEFPEEDESVGEVSIKYFGPNCSDIVQYSAINILLAYLASSSASVLENVLVEKEQITTAVYYLATPRPRSVIEFTLTGVDATQLAAVEARFLELINEVANQEFDMQYMRDCLARERRQQMFSAETSDQWFTSGIITTFLFSEDRSLDYLTHFAEFDELEKWSEPDWRNFFKKWIADAPRVAILGKPSATLSDKLKEEEEARVAEQKRSLGESGLAELKKKLEKAKEENDKPIPKEILEGFEIPSTDTIHFISTTPARSGRARDIEAPDNHIQKLINDENSDLLLYIHYEHIPSNFIHINILIGTGAIPVALRPLLIIYVENFFNTPIMRDGKRIEFEDVVKKLERDTVSFGISSASKLANAEILNLAFQVEADKYDIAISWIKDLFWNSIFDVDRIKSTTVRLLQDVPDEKRSGTDMTYGTAVMVQETRESVTRGSSTLVKAVYLKYVKHILKSKPETILAQLEEVRNALCQVSNLRVLVTADIEKLKSPVNAWKALTEGRDFSAPLAPLDERINRLTPVGRNPADSAYIIPMATIDSSYALAVSKGPEKPLDPRAPALLVAVAYLDAVEGPLWTTVRGAGLAYGTGFRRRLGQLEYSVYRSPDAYKAFAVSKKVLQDFISGERKLDHLAMEGAVSSIVLTIANAQATMVDAAADNIIMQVIREVPRDYNDILLEKVRNVTMEDVVQTMENLLLPIFLPQSSNLFVTCAPVMQENLLKGFSELGYKPEVRTLASFQDDYDLAIEDGEGDLDSASGSEGELTGESGSEEGSDN